MGRGGGYEKGWKTKLDWERRVVVSSRLVLCLVSGCHHLARSLDGWRIASTGFRGMCTCREVGTNKGLSKLGMFYVYDLIQDQSS